MDASNLMDGARIVPVVVIDDVETAVPLAECLLSAGLRFIEVTLRSDAGLKAIERIAEDVPDMVVGAGSIRQAEQVEAVSEAGAKFGVAPGATGRLLKAAEQASLPFIPGAATPSEMLWLLQRGYTLQKFFPAELLGGIAFLKAAGAPIPDVRFMPTGGISAANAADYLALKNVASVGGSWITPPGLLATRDFDAISQLASEAARL